MWSALSLKGWPESGTASRPCFLADGLPHTAVQQATDWAWHRSVQLTGLLLFFLVVPAVQFEDIKGLNDMLGENSCP